MELRQLEEYFARVESGACRMTESEAKRAFPRRGSADLDPTGVEERAIEYARSKALICVMLPAGGYEFRKAKL